MGVVSNVGTLSDTNTINRLLSNQISPEFKKGVVLAPLIYTEEMPERQGTATKYFQREGSLTTETAVAEATAQALQAPRSDDGVSATMAKRVNVQGYSIENQKFSVVNMQSYVNSAARLLGRAVDEQIASLFTSVTEQVDTEATALEIDDLDTAQFKILANQVPSSKRLIFMGSPKAYQSLKGEIRNSSSPAYSNDRFLSMFDNPPSFDGYMGTLPGYDLYMFSSGLAEVGDSLSQCMFHPDYAFAGTFDRAVSVETDMKGSEGGYTEIYSYFFWSAVIWNQAAAVEILSPAA